MNLQRLDVETFKNVIAHAPLVSIDLCIVHERKLLLGQRRNEPLKDVWFTPGGRILKGEAWSECLQRVADLELGLRASEFGDFRLMGIWDHFYDNSAFSKNISTHYVNLPHYIVSEHSPKVRADDQHLGMKWFELDQVVSGDDFHEYTKAYAAWLLENVVIT